MYNVPISRGQNCGYLTQDLEQTTIRLPNAKSAYQLKRNLSKRVSQTQQGRRAIGDKANGSNDLEQELRPMTVEKDDEIDMETLSDILREVEEETMTGETQEVKK